MARRFNGTSDFIVFTLPSTLEAVTAGSTTIVFVANFTDATDGAMVHARTSGGTNSWWMETFTEWNYGQGTTPKDVGDITTGSWAAYIGRKTTGGANAPRGRKIIFGGATTDVTAGTGLADGTAPGSGGVLQVGKWGTASEFISADVAAVAVFNSDLSDGTTATFTTWQAILDASPVWAVHFDQANAADAITDATGNGGNSSSITGTTIVANPDGFFGGDDTATPGVVAAVTTLPAVTVAAGSTPTPAAIAGTATLPAATVSAGSIETPAAVAVVAAVPAPTVSAGSTVTPAAVTAVTTLPAATVAASSTATPDVVTATTALPAATVSAGSTPTPATVQATVTVPGVTVSAGSTVTPDAIAATVALPAPTVSAGGSATVTPSPVAVTVAVPAVTVSAGSGVAPASIAAVADLPPVTVSVSATVTPAAIAFTITLPAPQVSTTGGATVTPATIAGLVGLPAPTVTGTGVPSVPVLTHVTAAPIRNVRAGPLTHISA